MTSPKKPPEPQGEQLQVQTPAQQEKIVRKLEHQRVNKK